MPKSSSSSSSWFRRFPWVSTALTLLVIVSAFRVIDPIRDAVDGGAVGDARLERSVAYVILGPISSLFDAMTLFTPAQIIGFTVWAMILFAACRIGYRNTRATSVRREAVLAGLAFLLLLVVYAAVIVLPRPMAQLIVTRADVLAVDFHTHTHFSHDGRSGWSAADVRDWHTAAGYNAAYVTDHATFDGANEAMGLDPAMVGQATTTLFPGIETFYHGEHVNILNAGYRYKGLTTADFTEVDDQALGFASTIPNAEPVLIETMPGDLSKLIPAGGPGTAGVRAIEIVDGSPRGMRQTHRDHDRIVKLADSLNLALVAGSDNHGWGRTAPGWTLLRIPGWRGYRPAALAAQIEDALRLSRRRGTKVVARTTAAVTPRTVAWTLPVVFWTVTRTLSPNERVAWIVWIWGLWIMVWLVRRRLTPPR